MEYFVFAIIIKVEENEKNIHYPEKEKKYLLLP